MVRSPGKCDPRGALQPWEDTQRWSTTPGATRKSLAYTPFSSFRHYPHLQPYPLYILRRMSASEQSNAGNFGSETGNLYGMIDKHK